MLLEFSKNVEQIGLGIAQYLFKQEWMPGIFLYVRTYLRLIHVRHCERCPHVFPEITGFPCLFRATGLHATVGSNRLMVQVCIHAAVITGHDVLILPILIQFTLKGYLLPEQCHTRPVYRTGNRC